MKVLHVPFTFYPDPMGGTEVYVASLARTLRRIGIESVVAAPGEKQAAYTYLDLDVVRYAASRDLSTQDLYARHDEPAARNFSSVLDSVRPDIVHFHALSPAVSPLCLGEAQRRGIPAVFTYHTPTVTCVRGTLMRWGDTVSDGRMLSDLCSACLLEERGVPRTVARAYTRLPALVGKTAARLAPYPPARTPLEIRALVRSTHESTRAMLSGVEQIVAPCEWVRAVLLRNRVPADRIVLSRQGVDLDRQKAVDGTAARTRTGALRKLVFLGRLRPEKGLHLLVEAMSLVPHLDISLDVYALGEEGSAYGARVREAAGRDPRIRFLPPIPNDQVIDTLARADALAVPVQGLETGPLVVLEAFAAGIPVIGSSLGGVAELVRDGVDGLLLPPDSAEAWAGPLVRLANEPHILGRLRAGVAPPRTMDDVARDMCRLYEGILTPRPATLPAQL